MQIALIDAGPLIAYYDASDDWHDAAKNFFENFKGKLVTSESVVTEVMWLLQSSKKVQTEFLNDLTHGLYSVEPMKISDFSEISKLNLKYQDRPADFPDLCILALSIRLNIVDVVSLDADFNVYRSSGKRFNQIFSKWQPHGKKSD